MITSLLLALAWLLRVGVVQMQNGTFPSLRNAPELILAQCPLTTATDGHTITVMGEVRGEPHDMAFEVAGCSETVLLVYAGETDSGVSANELRNDRVLRRFVKYTSSVYKSKAGHICIGCMKFGNVHAEITGRIQVASLPNGCSVDRLGFIRDSSGKFIGRFGWGHPIPFAKYRLVITSVSQVGARRLPRPE